MKCRNIMLNLILPVVFCFFYFQFLLLNNFIKEWLKRKAYAMLFLIYEIFRLLIIYFLSEKNTCHLIVWQLQLMSCLSHRDSLRLKSILPKKSWFRIINLDESHWGWWKHQVFFFYSATVIADQFNYYRVWIVTNLRQCQSSLYCSFFLTFLYQ